MTKKDKVVRLLNVLLDATEKFPGDEAFPTGIVVLSDEGPKLITLAECEKEIVEAWMGGNIDIVMLRDKSDEQPKEGG